MFVWRSVARTPLTHCQLWTLLSNWPTLITRSSWTLGASKYCRGDVWSLIYLTFTQRGVPSFSNKLSTRRLRPRTSCRPACHRSSRRHNLKQYLSNQCDIGAVVLVACWPLALQLHLEWNFRSWWRTLLEFACDFKMKYFVRLQRIIVPSVDEARQRESCASRTSGQQAL